MPTNSEMYERGAQDAEHDELNSFYYQHYYYYRRGYDDARRRARAARRPAAPPRLLLIALALALAAGAWWFLSFGRAPTEAQIGTPAPTPAPTARPRPTALPTTVPTAAPTALPTLAVGAQARVVNLSGSPLRARDTPGLSAPVVARIPEGAQVTIREGPIEADGFVWWRVEAQEATGWVAGRSPEGLVFLEATP